MCERVRTCARTRDTRTGIGHNGHPVTNNPQIAQKPRPYAAKTVYNYIFIYFFYMVTNGHHGHTQHHPTHLLFSHKYFLYALSEQQEPFVLLAVNT